MLVISFVVKLTNLTIILFFYDAKKRIILKKMFSGALSELFSTMKMNFQAIWTFLKSLKFVHH